MNRFVAVIVMVLVLVVFALFTTTYTVKYNEVAIKATFGEVGEDSVITEPGLHFRLPVFIDKVTPLDTRLQLVESPVEEIALADGQQIVARGFLLWRVDVEGSGPLDFFQKYQSVENAGSLIRGQFRSAFSAGLAQFAFDDLIGTESRVADAEEAIRASLASTLGAQGIVPDVVGISQIMLPPRTSRAVVERMQAERSVLARSEEQKGNAEASRLQAEANTQADKILAFANRLAEEIRNEAQAQAADYYALLDENAELAIFLEWLDALKRSLNGYTTIVLPANSAPWHLLTPESVDNAGGIPQPRSAPEDEPAVAPTSRGIDRDRTPAGDADDASRGS